MANRDDDIMRALGKIEGSIGGLEKHIIGVSQKIDREVGEVRADVKEVKGALDTHAKALDAHGVAAVDKSNGRMMFYVGLLVAASGLLGPFLWEGFKARVAPRPASAAGVAP